MAQTAELARPLPAPDRLDWHAVDRGARTMRALADPTRLLVLDQIMRAPCCELAVTDIAAALGISLPNASYHLKILAGAGVLARWRLGTSVSYSIAPANRQLVKFLLGRCRQP